MVCVTVLGTEESEHALCIKTFCHIGEETSQQIPKYQRPRVVKVSCYVTKQEAEMSHVVSVYIVYVNNYALFMLSRFMHFNSFPSVILVI